MPKLARFGLTTTYFLWNNEYYEQIEGAALESSLSPLGIIFMEKFEEEVIRSSRLKPKCQIRYVVDTLEMWQHGRETLTEFLNHFNNHQNNIKFTMKTEENGCLHCLDVLVQRDTNNTTEILNKNAFVPCKKKICDQDSRANKHIKEAIFRNGYNAKFIRKPVIPTEHPQNSKEAKSAYKCLPFVSGVTDTLRRILKRKKERTLESKQKQRLLPSTKDR